MTNEQLIQTAKESMRNDTVLNKGIVELLCNALAKNTEQRDALAAELSEVKSCNSEILKHVYRSKSYLDNNRAVDAAMGLQCAIEVKQRKTPHADAQLAALRAEWVEMFAMALRVPGDDPFMDAIAVGVAGTADKLARQLRESKGAQK